MDVPILLINLDRDTARLAHMRSEFGRLGLSYTRVPGILGTAIPEDLKPYFRTANGRIAASLRAEEIGCYASHLKALREVASGRHGAGAIVVEDDLALCDDLPDLLASLLQSLPRGWEIVRLSNPPKRAFVKLTDLAGARSLLRYSKIPNSAAAYLVSREGAEKLVATFPRIQAFDEDIRRPWLFGGLDTYGVIPAPVRPDIFNSSIDSIEEGRLKGRGTLIGRLQRTRLTEAPARIFFNIKALGIADWLACLGYNLAARLRLHKGPKSLG